MGLYKENKMEKGVFKDLKVADFSWVSVGPQTTRYLAHQGATVVRVESITHLDESRFVPPYKDGVTGINHSAFFTEFNTNKYSMTLNLNHPRAKEVAIRLIKWADIVAESFSAGMMARWGLSYEEVRKIKPDIIMYSTTMQGQTGPHCKHPGLGLNLLHLSGFSHLMGYHDSGPLQVHGAYTDWIAPRFGAVAIIAALDYRRRTGKGQYLDLSQFECALHLLAPALLEYSTNHRIVQREGNRSTSSAPHGAYRCQGENRWCVISVSNDSEWQSFCGVIGEPSWTKEPRFKTLLGRKKNEDELDLNVEEWTSKFTVEEVMSLMQQAKVPAGVVASGHDLFNDPQLKHRNHFRALDHSEMGTHSSQGISFQLSKTPSEITRAGPCLGQDTAYACSNILGMSDDEFTELVNAGVLE